MESALTIALSLLSGLIGAAIGHHFSLEQKRIERRHEAYVRFISAVCQIAKSRDNPSALAEAVGQLDEARFRILLYGGDRVRSGLANFNSRTDRNLANPRSLAQFLALIRYMQEDSGATTTSEEDARAILMLD